ncbi:MAG: cytochrome P450 [Microthrixaceae bacterium]
MFDLDEDVTGRAAGDPGFLQRCVHETVRLHPSSPVAMRWALSDVELPGGRAIARGDRVVIDLVAANRDPEAFGPDGGTFDPLRALPDGVAPWGLSFGLGMHACIGQHIAAGSEPTGEPGPDHLYGLVALAVDAVLRAGARRDPDYPPRLDPDSARGYWSSYPVVFGDARR